MPLDQMDDQNTHQGSTSNVTSERGQANKKGNGRYGRTGYQRKRLNP